MSIDTESPSFRKSFERWRLAITSLVSPSSPIRFEPAAEFTTSTTVTNGQTMQKWEDGKIMQPAVDVRSNKDGSEMDAAALEKERKRLRKECKTCEKWRDELTRESPIIRFMLQHISLLPPPDNAPPSEHSSTPHLPLPIVCKPCPSTLAGGYSSSLGILLCQNRFMSKKHMEDALAHELIHAWDERRFEVKGEWAKDLRAHACTEIRAENLSGDCRWGREFTRRNWSWTKQQQACVRRRAILSVAANPNCPSREEAEKAVNEVFESCWSDTRPFDEIYA